MKLNIKETFNKELPADVDQSNARRQVHKACFSYATPRVPSAPKVLHVSDEMLENIGLKSSDKASEDFLNIFSGATVIEGTTPFAMCYGGHQFGSWAGQLGDGRAINLTEVEHNNQRWALQLKGAGETPYSRTADGLAVLRSSVREHLCSEAMYHLGVPTTRSLSLMLTGDEVLRDVLYNGNAAYEKGAVVCRVAPSFIRFGNFQIFASRGDKENLQALINYTIRHFYPHLQQDSKEGIIALFRTITTQTVEMVVEWQRVGFVHGVMNTDNMSILGLTIDYGPYGWLEGYDQNWTPNTTDNTNRRYRYGYQPGIALWNLNQLANAFLFLVEDPAPFEEILKSYKIEFADKYMEMMSKKIGIEKFQEEDFELIKALEIVLQKTETDMTIFFRNLSNLNLEIAVDNTLAFLEPVKAAFYKPEELKGEIAAEWVAWFTTYTTRLKKQEISSTIRKAKMDKVNPKYVLRNYMAQLAIDAADKGDYTLIDELYQLLKKPYDEQPRHEKWFAKRPEWARNKVGCSMLSCSS